MGKDYALSNIYRQNIDFLFFYGKKFTADEELVLDVIQDLFCYIIEKRESLGTTENIRMYLLKSFRRRLFNELKKINKRLAGNEDVLEPKIVFSAEEELITEEEQSEKRLELKLGLKKLNSKQREVLYYKFNCGFDYDQICSIMEISYSSARQMVSRAVNTLKSHMWGKGFIFLLYLRKRLL